MSLNNFLFLLILVSFSHSHAAGDTAPAAASTCIGCHGVSGISSSPLWPNLAGQKEGYISKQLTDFKSGQRKDPLMSPISMSLSDKDISELARYFANLK